SEGCKAKWAPELTPYFKDRHVIILVDSDKGGRRYGQKIARALYKVATSVRVVDLYPERNDGSDVFDWLQTDTAGVKLIKAVNHAPIGDPSAHDAKDEPRDDTTKPDAHGEKRRPLIQDCNPDCPEAQERCRNGGSVINSATPPNTAERREWWRHEAAR